MLFTLQNCEFNSDLLMSKGISFVATRKPQSIVSLTSEEKHLMSNAPLKRRQDFATGRWCARQALNNLGIASTTISIGARREPIWPTGITGSISHTKDYYCAAVSLVKSALGVDAENLANSFRFNKTDNIKKVCTNQEYKKITSIQQTLINFTCHVIFSAKESFYKSVYPIIKTFIDYKDVEIEIDWKNLTYEVLLVKDLSSSLIKGKRFRGDYWISENTIVTLITFDDKKETS
jgi:enterobactin synthetase component D